MDISLSDPQTQKGEAEGSKRGGWGIINLPNTDVGPKRGTGSDMLPLASEKSGLH